MQRCQAGINGHGMLGCEMIKRRVAVRTSNYHRQIAKAKWTFVLKDKGAKPHSHWRKATEPHASPLKKDISSLIRMLR